MIQEYLISREGMSLDLAERADLKKAFSSISLDRTDSVKIQNRFNNVLTNYSIKPKPIQEVHSQLML